MTFIYYRRDFGSLFWSLSRRQFSMTQPLVYVINQHYVALLAATILTRWCQTAGRASEYYKAHYRLVCYFAR